MRGLTPRLALAMSGIALVAALLAGALTAPLLSSATTDAVREPLARQADLLARLPVRTLDSARVETITGRVDLAVGTVSRTGRATGSAEVLSTEQVRDVLAGSAVSTTGTYGGHEVLVEARRARGGGAVVVLTDIEAVDAVAERLRRRVLMAIAVGLVASLVMAWLVAAWLGRPLATTAAAARRLADGEREVALPDSSTREIADVASALGALDVALRASEGRQRDFLMSVSHELRTPLTTVRGYAEALADGVVAPEETAEVGRTLKAESLRLERYVDDLLRLARLQSDEYSLDIADVDLAELLVEAAAAWADRAARTGVQVDVRPTGVVVRTDPARVRQVLDALTDNAVRACAAGDTVVLQVDPVPGGARLQVRDSGPGLTADDAAVAFEPGVLHQRYAGSRPGGHGLGLAIVDRLVRRLGGTASVTTAPEGGAAFVVDLPHHADPSQTHRK